VPPTRHRYIAIEGVDLFYREAGPASAPTLLLLHGFPSSSIEFRHLFATLSDRWHLVAPDFPGFGLSMVPDHTGYEYSFGNLAATVAHFLERLKLAPAALYLHDYGAQAGFRLLTRGAVQPDFLIIQNSEAYYADGRTNAWEAAEDYWRDPSAINRAKMRDSVLTEEGIRREFLEDLNAETSELIDPAIIQLAYEHIRRPEVIEANLDLHLDYRTNVQHYVAIQAYLRERQPRTLVIWGREDQYYTTEQAFAFRRDLPAARIEILDGGHWVLESHGDQVSNLSRAFLDSRRD
jgi:pimeloyl-ACP methyl ester carboxylesterase